MKRRFTEEQIIGVLREQEAGGAVKEIIRRHGISEQSFYRWKAKYGGMEVSEARRLRELEAENAKLKPCPASPRGRHLAAWCPGRAPARSARRGPRAAPGDRCGQRPRDDR